MKGKELTVVYTDDINTIKRLAREGSLVSLDLFFDIWLFKFMYLAGSV